MAWDSFLSDEHGPPRGVSRRAWNEVHTKLMIGAALMGFGLVMLLFRLLVSQHAQKLAEIPLVSLAEAAQHQGEPRSPVQLVGTLQAQQPVQMPDSQEAVVRGQLTILVRDMQNSATEHQILLDWHETASAVFLTDGITSLPLQVPSDQLSLKVDHQARVTYQYEGQSARTSVRVLAKIGSLSFDLKQLGMKDPIVEVTRAVLVDQQPVVLFAGLQAGGKIVAPPGEQLTLLHGTPAQARTGAVFFSRALIVVGLMLVAGGGLLRRAGKAQRRQLLARVTTH